MHSIAPGSRGLLRMCAAAITATASVLVLMAWPAPSAAAGLTATVTPDSDLAPGATVTVSWTGGTPSPNGYAIYTICVRGTLSPGEGALYCDTDFSFALNDANGAASGQLQVAPGTYGSAGESCSTTCFIAVSEPQGETVLVPISFASGIGTTTTTAGGTTTTIAQQASTTTAPPTQPTTTAPASAATPAASTLPRTGAGSTAVLSLLGLALLAAGAAVTLVARRARRGSIRSAGLRKTP